MTYKHTPSHYAKKYEVSERTIRRWQVLSYPLDDAALLARIVKRQKNTPESYQSGTAPGTANRHGLTPTNLAFAVVAQMMRHRVRRLTRAIEGALTKGGKKEDLVTAVQFGSWLIDRAVSEGVKDMAKAKHGVPLSQIKEERRKAELEFNGPEEDGK